MTVNCSRLSWARARSKQKPPPWLTGEAWTPGDAGAAGALGGTATARVGTVVAAMRTCSRVGAVVAAMRTCALLSAPHNPPPPLGPCLNMVSCPGLHAPTIAARAPSCAVALAAAAPKLREMATALTRRGVWHALHAPHTQHAQQPQFSSKGKARWLDTYQTPT